MDETQYTVGQVAERLRLDKSKIYLFIHTKKLRAVNISTGETRPNWRISSTDFDSFLKERETDGK